MTAARLTKQLAECDKRIAKATARRKSIEDAIEKRRNDALAIDTSPMSARDLGELVADAARSHGGDCGRAGYAHTSESWKVFRKRLSELVGRANETRTIAAELSEARAEVERLRAMVPSAMLLGELLEAIESWDSDGFVDLRDEGIRWHSRVEAAKGGERG